MENRKRPQILPGGIGRLGVEKTEDGCRFTAVFPEKEEAALLLYHKGKSTPCEEISMPYQPWNGRVRSVLLKNFQADRYEYNYLVNEQVCQDPRAGFLVGRREFGEEWPQDPHQIRCGFLEEGTPAKEDPLEIPYEELILYKVHVRGYTRQKNSKVRKKGTFAGLMEKIPYWKELGINGLELMPAYEFEEVQRPEQTARGNGISRMQTAKRLNYWGYTGGYYYAPKSSYADGARPDREFRALVEALHQAGIECIMEFYFEKDFPMAEILNILRFWKKEYRIDGFHLLGGEIPQDFLVQDPFLQGTKLFFLNVWDAYKGPKKTEELRCLAEYNGGFSEVMRRLLKGDEGMIESAAFRMRNNPSGYGVINYITIQDGFTLADLVSYDQKHNEANGEENRDGSDCNYSWNCGIEGPSRKAGIRALRRRQIRNAWLLLLFSQGTPLLYGGDEFCNTQDGNNNAYCQDNETGWVDWRLYKKNEDMVEFVRQAIAFRRKHACLHMKSEPRGTDYRAVGYPDISYHSQKAWYGGMEYSSRSLGVMYCCAYGEEKPEEKFLYLAYNLYWEEKEFALPKLPEDDAWQVLLDTSGAMETAAGETEDGAAAEQPRTVTVPPRTILVLAGK